MAKIKLSEGGYTPIPEGEHIFKIVKTNYEEDFGKLEIDMVTANGQKHKERFSLIRNDGEINEGALNAFSYFAKTALNNFNLDEIDPEDIEGCYVKCDVEHDVQPHNKDPKKTVTFLRLQNMEAASGFDTTKEVPKDAPKTTKTSNAKAPVDLDALLG